MATIHCLDGFIYRISVGRVICLYVSSLIVFVLPFLSCVFWGIFNFHIVQIFLSLSHLVFRDLTIILAGIDGLEFAHPWFES